MARINGTDLIISVGGTAVAHTTSASLSVEMATIDVSSKDSAGVQELLGGQISASLDFEGLTDFSGSVAIDDLLTDLQAREAISWTLADTAGNTFSGSGFVTSISLDAPMEDAATFSGSIAVSGAVTFAAAS